MLENIDACTCGTTEKELWDHTPQCQADYYISVYCHGLEDCQFTIEYVKEVIRNAVIFGYECHPVKS